MNIRGKTRVKSFGFVLCVVVIYFLWFYIPWKPESDEVSLKDLLATGIRLAVMGGREVVQIKMEKNMQERSKGKTKEGSNDPVTNADLHSHCVMYYGLKEAYPSIMVISEEKLSKKTCKELGKLPVAQIFSNPMLEKINDDVPDELIPLSDITVWIDPLDATQEYTENLLQYVTTMVCISVNGRPTIGIIHQPFLDKPLTVWGWVHKSISQDLIKIKSENLKRSTLSNFTFIVSRSHSGKVKEMATTAFGSSSSIVAAGGAGYKVLEVVRGNADAYIHTTAIKKWDICAGNAIVRSLGGHMTTLRNDEIHYDSTTNVVNSDGLLVTMSNHQWFHDKLRP